MLIVFLVAVLVRWTNPPSLVYEIRFDDKCAGQTNCLFFFDIKKKIEGPVYVYLYFKDFFVHHRKMARSQSAAQLGGDWLTPDELESSCDSKVTNNDGQFARSYAGEDLVGTASMTPCGIYPYYFPKDDLKIYKKGEDSMGMVVNPDKDKEVKISSEGIIWDVLKENKYSAVENSEKRAWVDIKQNGKVNLL